MKSRELYQEVLFQRVRVVSCDTFECFIDCQKVERDKLIEGSKAVGTVEDLQIFGNLYWNQTIAVSIEGEDSDAFPIRR